MNLMKTLFWLALVGMASAAAAPDIDPAEILTGTFIAVDVRPASGADDISDISSGADFLGKALTFDGALGYAGTETCGGYVVERLESSPIDIKDPVLSDLQMRPGDPRIMSRDRRLNLPIQISCEGQAFVTLVAIDRRVLVLSLDEGNAFLIAEKPLSGAQVTRVQKILTGRKMYDGAVDGGLDDATRQGIGHFAKARGADRVFERAVVTENLFDGLGVMELE